MYCNKCGSELSEGSIFCAKCGKKIGVASTAMVTEQVANEQKWGMKFAVITAAALLIVSLIVIVILFLDTNSASEESSDRLSGTYFYLDDNGRSGYYYHFSGDTARFFDAYYIPNRGEDGETGIGD
jgi:hypothetical protein